MGKAFEMMMAGLQDAIAFAEGDESRCRVAHVGTPVDVKKVRTATRKTQAQFASSYRLPLGTVRDWEQNRTRPDAPARALLALIAADPDTVERLLAQERKESRDR